MELRLYNRLCKELLGPFAQALQARDPEYQNLVESFASAEQTGIAQEASQKIKSWMETYNRLQSSKFRLRYYQILALYFTEYALSGYLLTNRIAGLFSRLCTLGSRLR